ncbi:MAG TPA: hypothetical protein VHR47_06480 [Bacillota bacterium]|nr:hypothetical protein [Bacillota bacterium]
MKRAFFVLAVMLLLMGPAVISAGSNRPELRNMSWGMTLKEVKQAENLSLTYEEKDALVYNTELVGFPCSLLYFFQKDSLYRGGYAFTQTHANATDFIGDYGRVKNYLKQQYGEPKSDEVIWKDSRYQEDPSQWGLALKTGGLELCSRWEKEGTEILLLLSGDKDGLNFMLVYNDNEQASMDE